MYAKGYEAGTRQRRRILRAAIKELLLGFLARCPNSGHVKGERAWRTRGGPRALIEQPLKLRATYVARRRRVPWASNLLPRISISIFSRRVFIVRLEMLRSCTQ